MTRRDYIRASTLMAAMRHFPPLVRNVLIEDRELNKQFGINTDAVLAFETMGVEFQRSELVAAIREASKKPGEEVELKDKAGSGWAVTVSSDKNNPAIAVKSGDTVIQIVDMAVVGEDAELREKVFSAHAERVNLPTDAADKWKAIIKERAIDADEISELTDDLARTPIAVARSISERLAQGNISLDTLVPRSLEYYERLIGKVEGQPTIKEYAREVATPFVSGLLAWHPTDGVKQALLLGSHSLIVKAIGSLQLDAGELKKLIEWADQRGDVLSRGALIEVALGMSKDKDTIGESLDQLVATYGGEKQEAYDQYGVFSAAFVMVYGELAQIGLIATKPVYWQRLAAIAQAALITRCVLSSPTNLEKLIEWMSGIRSQQYVLRCYIDQRTDPMWLAEFGLPGQLKNEFAGRVLVSAMSNEEATDTLGLREKLLGDKAPSLNSQLVPLLTHLNGPLEGNIFPIRAMLPEDVDKIREELLTASPSIHSFSALVTVVLLAKIPPEFPKMAADALRRVQYKLDAPGEPNTLAKCLLGLATVAAITRSIELAEALFIVVRIYRRHHTDELTIDEAFRIGITACASRSELPEWCKAVGAFVTDFSFGELSREEAADLRPLVVSLCNMVPELWAACGEGLAAIEAIEFQ